MGVVTAWRRVGVDAAARWWRIVWYAVEFRRFSDMLGGERLCGAACGVGGVY